MNFTRKTIFWVIALVFLGGLFHLLDEQAEETKKVEERQLRLFSASPEQVTEFWSVNLAENRRIHGVRDGKEWKLLKPISTKGDEKAIAKLLKNIVDARKDAILFEEPTPEKLQELGLATPEQEMGFVIPGQPPVVIQFGNLGPTHNIAYARFQGEKRVLRVHSDLKQEANHSLYSLRDKTILDFDPLQMVRLELTRTKMPRVVIRHEQDRWDMEEPVQARANMAKVLETVYAIKNSEIKEFPEANDESNHAMDNPLMTVAILLKGSTIPLRLQIGAKDRARRGYYAKRGEDATLFVVEEDLVAALMANDNTWKESQ